MKREGQRALQWGSRVKTISAGVPAREGVRRSGRRIAQAAVIATAVMGMVSTEAAAVTSADTPPRQWYLERMDAEKMWQKATGEGVKIALIDSGVNPSTPSLAGQVLPGWDLRPEGSVRGQTMDRNGQGTSHAELMVGTGEGGGIKGLAPGAKVIPMRIPLIKHDELPPIVYPVNRGIRRAVDEGAKIISISVTSQWVAAGLDTFTNHADLEYAQSKGVLVFAAAGDNAKDGNKKQYPAAFPEVVGVGALNEDASRWVHTQHGEVPDLAAPGAGLPRWCDATFTRYCTDGAGTAAASALAAASAALIWSLHPDWTSTQVLRVMYDTAGRGEDWAEGTRNIYFGYGSVRPGAHINRGKGTPGPADPGMPIDDVAPIAAASPSTANSPKPSAPAAATAQHGTGESGSLLLYFVAASVAVVISGAAITFYRRRSTGR